MLNTRTLIQNILDKDAAGVNEAFSAILEQKIAEKIEEITPAISNELFDLEEKAKFDDDDDEEYEEKKAKKSKEKARDNARAAKSKDMDEEIEHEISEELIQAALAEAKIPGAEYASPDLVGLHVKHQRHMATARNSMGYYGDNGGSAADAKSAISKAASLEREIAEHPDTKAFHEKHGWKKEHPAKLIAQATSHLHEESEQLDELNKSTLASYTKKAATSAYINHAMAQKRQDDSHLRRRDSEYHKKRGDHVKSAEADDDSFAADVAAQKHSKKVLKRTIGIGRATSRLAKESEQLDELTKKTLGRYINKASHDMSDRSVEATVQGIKASKAGIKGKSDDAEGHWKDYDDSIRKQNNRSDGIRRAVKRLSKESTENLEEKAKFDDEDGDDYVSKLAKKAKEKVRDKARKAKESSKESSE